MRRVLAAAALIVVVAGCGDDGASVEAFCEQYEVLSAADPFADVGVAYPEEVEAAYQELEVEASRLAAAAPDDTIGAADEYAAAVEEMIDQLRAAQFDLRRVDSLRFNAVVDDYYDAAARLDRAARSLCDQQG